MIPQALGDCYQQLGNFQRAEEYYLQAAAYTYINLALEAPAPWVRLAQNALLWGDHLYRQEQIDACKEVYGKVVGSDGTAPAGPLYDLVAFAGPATEAKKVLAAIADSASAGVDPGLALPIVTIWQRWQYLLGGLDYYGTSYTPIFTFEYLQQVALGFAQQAIQAEQEYVNFQVHAEAEAATRRGLRGRTALRGRDGGAARAARVGAVGRGCDGRRRPPGKAARGGRAGPRPLRDARLRADQVPVRRGGTQRARGLARRRDPASRARHGGRLVGGRLREARRRRDPARRAEVVRVPAWPARRHGEGDAGDRADRAGAGRLRPAPGGGRAASRL